MILQLTGTVLPMVDERIDSIRAHVAASDSLFRLARGRAADAEAVWRFLLESGFLYPQKLAEIQADAARSVWIALLDAPPSVSQTLLAIRGDRIEGHVNALRVYSRTFLCQHLAASPQQGSARSLGRRLALAQVDAMLHTPEAEWLRLIFRPDNPWPMRLFGGFARAFEDPDDVHFRIEGYATSICTIDHAATARSPKHEVRFATQHDHAALLRFVADAGDSVYLRSDDFSDAPTLDGVQRAFRALGLQRRRELLVLERAGRLAGIAALEISSPSLNFSELTRAFRVYTDPGDHGAVVALGNAARQRYHALGFTSCVALAGDHQAAALATIGFALSRRYCRFTLHRRMFARLYTYLERPSRAVPL